MINIRYYTALIAAKTSKNLLKFFGKSSGTSFPGLISLKICPDFLKYAQKYAEKGIINITGTNGKTTTAGLFANILHRWDKSVLHNEKGANMLTGIASAISDGIGFKKKNDFFVLESDEAYLTRLFDYLKSDMLLVTNLFRDQLDRYGELDTTFKKIQEAIDKNSDLTVLLNADDPMVTLLGKNNPRKFFGFESIDFMFETQNAKAPIETVECSFCGKNLHYNKRFYAHLGDYYCTCGYKKPFLDYSANALIYHEYSLLKVHSADADYEFKIFLPGLYNVYNALGAVVLALEYKIPFEIIQKGLESYKSVFGRAEKIKINNKDILIQLIKNPVGASEVLRLTANAEKSKLLIILNDNYADGRDVSWIWDADFELLKNYKQQIIISGERAYDMAVRLKYAGVDESLISTEKDIKTALQEALKITNTNEKLYILPTYTALLKMQNIIKELN